MLNIHIDFNQPTCTYVGHSISPASGADISTTTVLALTNDVCPAPFFV